MRRNSTFERFQAYLRCQGEADVGVLEDNIEGWGSYVCGQLAATSASICQVTIPRSLCRSSCYTFASTILNVETSPGVCQGVGEFEIRRRVDSLFRECSSNPFLAGVFGCVEATENEAFMCRALTTDAAFGNCDQLQEGEGICDFEEMEDADEVEGTPTERDDSNERDTNTASSIQGPYVDLHVIPLQVPSSM